MRLNGWQGIGIVASVICGWLAASLALAEEVLYCVDTQSLGFQWDKAGTAQISRFTGDRYTIKILSDTQRIMTPMVGDTAGTPVSYTCHKTYDVEGRIACDNGSGSEPWLFHRNTYTRAFLAGPPAGGHDQNIWMSYGTCTKF